eukprot:5481151-Prymnesium_polylepis.1
MPAGSSGARIEVLRRNIVGQTVSDSVLRQCATWRAALQRALRRSSRSKAQVGKHFATGQRASACDHGSIRYCSP